MSDGTGIASNRMVMQTAGMKFYPSGSSIISSTYRPNLVKAVARISCSLNNPANEPLALENLRIQKPEGVGRYIVGNPNFEIQANGIGEMIVGHTTASFEIGTRLTGSTQYDFDYTLRRPNGGVGDSLIWDGNVSGVDTFEVGLSGDRSTGFWLFGLAKSIVCGYYTTRSFGYLTSSNGITSRPYDFTSTSEPSLSLEIISKSFNGFKYPSASTAQIHYIPIPIKSGDTSYHVATASVVAVNNSVFGPNSRNFISASCEQYDEFPEDQQSQVIRKDPSFYLHDQLGGTSQLDTRKYGIGWLEIGDQYNAFQVFDLSNGIGESQIGSTFMIGDGYQDFHATGINKGPVFTAARGNLAHLSQSLISGSGIAGRPYYQGVPQQSQAAAEFKLEAQGSDSFLITGSNDASMYFSGSGKIGIGTKTPKTAFDVKADDFKIRSKDGKRELKFDGDGRLSTKLFASSSDEQELGGTVLLTYTPGTFESASQASVGDTIGTIMWVDESLNTVDKFQGSGSAAKITSTVRGTSPLGGGGIIGDLEFKLNLDSSTSSSLVPFLSMGPHLALNNNFAVHFPYAVSMSSNLHVHGYISSSDIRGVTSGKVTTVDTGDDNNTYYPILADNATGDSPFNTDAGLNYNALTNYLSVDFVGSGDGWVKGTFFTGSEVRATGAAGHITASGNMSASGLLGIETTHITSSGNVSSSGNIIGKDLTLSGDLTVGDDSTINGNLITFRPLDGTTAVLRLMDDTNDFFTDFEQSDHLHIDCSHHSAMNFGISTNKHDEGASLATTAATIQSHIFLDGLTGETVIHGPILFGNDHEVANVTASNHISASGDIIANNVGWHGSNNRIKILPRDFQADDVGRPVMFEDGTSNERHMITHGSAKSYASVEIPSGFTATHVMVYGSDTGQTHTTYLADVTSKAVTEKGSATALGTEKAITNVTSSTLNYLLIEVSSDGSDDELTGGYVTIIKT